VKELYREGCNGQSVMLAERMPLLLATFYFSTEGLADELFDLGTPFLFPGARYCYLDVTFCGGAQNISS
jgi:hypothetical protein